MRRFFSILLTLSILATGCGGLFAQIPVKTMEQKLLVIEASFQRLVATGHKEAALEVVRRHPKLFGQAKITTFVRRELSTLAATGRCPQFTTVIKQWTSGERQVDLRYIQRLGCPLEPAPFAGNSK